MNIVLITTDQQRYDALGIAGSSFLKTPNLDRIGREGVVFNRAYCPHPICTPSRVSLMTGQYPSMHGSYNIGCLTPESSDFLPDVLRRAGFQTYHVGKAHFSCKGNPDSAEYRDSPEADCSEPFRSFFGFEEAEVARISTDFRSGHYGHWLERQGYGSDEFRFEVLFPDDPNQTGNLHVSIDLHLTSWIAQRAISFLEAWDRRKPFFLNIAFPDPHHPHTLPVGFEERIGPDEIPFPSRTQPASNEAPPPHIPLLRNGKIHQSRFAGRYRIAGQVANSNWEEYLQNEELVRLTRSYYYSNIQFIDDRIGRILKTLDHLDAARDTLVIFTSDHGEMLGDHGIFQKGPVAYEEIVRVPLLMRMPAQLQTSEIDEPVSLVDLVPTILDLLDIKDQAHREGRTLRTFFHSGESPLRHGVRVEYREDPGAIQYKLWVTKRWKLVVYPDEEFGELYDLERDPHEEINLYADVAYRELKEKLLLALISDLARGDRTNPRVTRS